MTNAKQTRQVAFRLPIALIARLEELAHTLSEERPGVDVTRADVVRMLLLRGLDATAPVSENGK